MEAYELQNIFSNNIYEARTNLGYSQMKLAELADISTGFLCDIERGLKTGTFDTIVKISAALKKEPYELFIPSNIDVASVVSAKMKSDFLSELTKSLEENVGKAIQETVNRLSVKDLC